MDPAKQQQEKAQKENDRAQKEVARKEAEKTLHDDKVNKSAAMFKNTKITSCSQILQKNGQNVCLAF